MLFDSALYLGKEIRCFASGDPKSSDSLGRDGLPLDCDAALLKVLDVREACAFQPVHNYPPTSRYVTNNPVPGGRVAATDHFYHDFALTANPHPDAAGIQHLHDRLVWPVGCSRRKSPVCQLSVVLFNDNIAVYDDVFVVFVEPMPDFRAGSMSFSKPQPL